MDNAHDPIAMKKGWFFLPLPLRREISLRDLMDVSGDISMDHV